MVKSVHNINNVYAGKFSGSEPRSVVDAGIYSHSGGAGAVPVINFEKNCNSSTDHRFVTPPADERTDPPSDLPADEDMLLMGSLNAHHPQWDLGCDAAYEVGALVETWLESVGWTTLNFGEPNHVSYRSGSQTTPDLAACSASLARRAT